MSNPRTVEEIEGPWRDPEFESGLIQRCRQYWSVPIENLPNEALAMFLRQRIGLSGIVPDAKRRIEAGIDDDSEMYDGELSEALHSSGEN